ncbi:MAG: metallophosphoesterase [Planctomycetota bacterium]
MRIWALSDLHLSLGGDKPMDVFGAHWLKHHERMAAAWDDRVAPEDIVLSPGDVSWAGKPREAEADFAWLAQRPGRVVILKGNHDHWWPKSKTKLQQLLPANVIAIKRNAVLIDGVALYGCRGGDFAPLKQFGDERGTEAIEQALQHEERELRLSLEQLQLLGAGADQEPRLRICLFHYPPMPPGRTRSRFTPLIQDGGARYCIYGHLHGRQVGQARIEGEIDGICYRCTSCDLLDFEPTLVAEL